MEQGVLKLNRSRSLFWPLVVLGVWIILSLMLADRQLVINTSPSVAPGIYLRIDENRVSAALLIFGYRLWPARMFMSVPGISDGTGTS